MENHNKETETKPCTIQSVSVNEVEFCTCENPSGEGNIQMVNYEEMLYFCCDCGKQVKINTNG